MDNIRRYQLDDHQRKQVIRTISVVLQKKREILFAYIYGSFNEEIAFRDIDLGIFLKDVQKSEVPDYEIDLSMEIEKKLDVQIPFDTRVINEAPLPFRFRVLKGLLLFSRDDEFLTEYMIQTARSYLDFAPLRNRYLAEAIA